MRKNKIYEKQKDYSNGIVFLFLLLSIDLRNVLKIPLYVPVLDD